MPTTQDSTSILREFRAERFLFLGLIHMNQAGPFDRSCSVCREETEHWLHVTDLADQILRTKPSSKLKFRKF